MTTSPAAVVAPHLRLLDMATGQELILRDLADVTAADAYHLHVNIDAFIQELYWWRKRLGEMIESDITAEPGRTEVIRDGIVYRYAGDEAWVVDPARAFEVLSTLRDAGHIDQADFESAYKEVVTAKVDNRILNALAKKRGQTVADAIATCRQRVVGAPKLTIERVPS